MKPKNTKKTEDRLSEFFTGQVMPQNVQLEECVLGAVLIDRDAFSIALGAGISEQSFYLDDHKLIFKAMQSLAENSQPIDIFTVTQKIKSVGGMKEGDTLSPYYLVEISNKVASAANLEYHCRIIRQSEARRVMIERAQEITLACYDQTEDPIELQERFMRAIADASGLFSISQEKEGVQVGRGLFKEITNRRNGVQTAQPIFSGLGALDEITDGFYPGELVIIAARPSVGKSSLLTTIARSAATTQGRKVGLMSLEMRDEDQMLRLVSIETQISAARIRKGTDLTDSEYKQVAEAIGKVQDWPIVYYSGDRLLGVCLAKARRMVAMGCEALLVDYLQLLAGAGSIEERVSQASSCLKELATTLNIPVIAAAQLSREGEKEGHFKLSHLRGSGAIEQDADKVIIVDRPETRRVQFDENGVALPKGYTVAMVMKNRNGSLGDAELRFVDFTTQFQELETTKDLFDQLPPLQVGQPDDLPF